MVKRLKGILNPRLEVSEQTDESAIHLTNKAKLSLYKKSVNSGISADILEEVYYRGYTTWNESFDSTPEQFGFDRVNSFIAGGFAAEKLDADLMEKVKKPTGKLKDACWTGYTAVGMKMKGGRKVPNCVPVKEEQVDEAQTPRQKAHSVRVKNPKEGRSSAYASADVERTNFPMPTHNVSVTVSKNGGKKEVKKVQVKAPNKHSAIFNAQMLHHEQGYKVHNVTYKGSPDKKFGSANEEVENAETISPNFVDASSRFIGSDSLTKVYASMTPGQLTKAIVKKVVKEKVENDAQHHRDEKEMAKTQLKAIAAKASNLASKLKGKDLEAWMQYKINNAKDGVTAVNDVMTYREETQQVYEGEGGGWTYHTDDEIEQFVKNANKEKSDKLKVKIKRGYDKLAGPKGKLPEEVEVDEDWQDSKYKNPTGGLTKAGVMAYRREHPGSKLKTAVTTKPSKLKKGSKAWNRRKSFCARMGGMKKRLTSAKTAHDPDSRINKALRKWNCE